MSKFDRNRIKDGWEKLCTKKQTHRQTDTTKIMVTWPWTKKRNGRGAHPPRLKGLCCTEYNIVPSVKVRVPIFMMALYRYVAAEGWNDIDRHSPRPFFPTNEQRNCHKTTWIKTIIHAAPADTGTLVVCCNVPVLQY